MTANDIKNTVFVGKTVTETTFIAYGGHHQILSFGYLVWQDVTDILVKGPLNETNQEHLIHMYLAVFLVNILETFRPQVNVQLLNSGHNLALQTFLGWEQD